MTHTTILVARFRPSAVS